MAVQGENRQWSTALLDKTRPCFALHSWPESRLILRRFLWSEVVWGPSHMSVRMTLGAFKRELAANEAPTARASGRYSRGQTRVQAIELGGIMNLPKRCKYSDFHHTIPYQLAIPNDSLSTQIKAVQKPNHGNAPRVYGCPSLCNRATCMDF